MTNRSRARKEISRTLIITSSNIPLTNFFFSAELKILKIFSAILLNCVTGFYFRVRFDDEVQFIAPELKKTNVTYYHFSRLLLKRGSDAKCSPFRSIYTCL
jgi:hypothetical protein